MIYVFFIYICELNFDLHRTETLISFYKKYFLLIISTLAAILFATLFSSCKKEDLSTNGYLVKFKINDIIIDNSISTLSKAITPPSISSFTLNISPKTGESNPNNSYSGSANIESLLLLDGQYNCNIQYGINNSLAENIIVKNTPYYYGSTSFTVNPGNTSIVEINAEFKGAAISLIATEELLAQFSSYSFKAVSGSTNVSFSPSDKLFVQAGIPLQIILEGINSLGESKTITIADINSTANKTEYIFSCKANLPTINLPEQDPLNSYTACHYISKASVGNSTRAQEIENNLIYEASPDNWNTIYTATQEGNNLKFNIPANTQEHKTYLMRARYGKIQSNIVSFTSERAEQLMYSDLDTWTNGSANGQTIYYIGNTASNTYWASRNTQTMSEGANAWYTRCPGTRPTSDAVSGNAASITTVGWGSGNTWAGAMWSAVIYNISSGWLVYGDVSSAGAITKNRVFASRPNKFNFYYKYTPKASSVWQLNVELLKNGVVIGTCSTGNGNSVSAYQNVSLDINYSSNQKPDIIYVFFTNRTDDSKNKDFISKESNPNRYQGAMLYIDNISLTYLK